MGNITGLDLRLHEVAERIRELRMITGLTPAEMAGLTDVPLEEYLLCESGEGDLTFAFIYRCAIALGVDVTDIIEGKSPTLRSYTVTRAGRGQRIQQAHGMVYYGLASSFRGRISEPLFVRAIWSEEAQNSEIELTTHTGQECDIVVSGSLKVRVGSHQEVLGPGDSIYYDSSTPHGMIAVGGEDCMFYAIVLNPNGENLETITHADAANTPALVPAKRGRDDADMIWHRYVDVEEDENGTPTSIKFKNEDKFNFAFDVVDDLGRRKPDRLAMLHVDRDHVERRFTFAQVKRASSQCANYFKSLGIKRGDRVMLVLRRHYQFWFAILGLHKLGAIAILGSNQLRKHDFEYRFEAAGITSILCTALGDVADEAEAACESYGKMANKIIVGGQRDGWHTFDSEYELFTGKFTRTEDAPCGDDRMLMFFTSGTTGYPKIASHNYKYPLGHFHTAHYWHNVNPDGLHLTISDTGWAKSMWGKLYGQWLSEGAIFVYDFDRFDAADILPMFKKYRITTFCAPPTIYRMMIKEDLSKYDLSSVECATVAGEALNPEVIRQLKLLTGLDVKEGFGQTETTLVIGNLTGAETRVGAMGKPVPIYDVDLVDPDDKPVANGETGEIVIRIDKGSPCGLFTEYYLDEEKTLEVRHDGLYHTGDVAWRDEDGFFWYVGRVDDVIKSSGYRIGPFEIESVIMELPYVLECGVSPVPDEVRGQIVKASIVLTKGTEGTEELKKEIQTYVKTHSAPYKYPRIVEFKDSLPKTVSGKIIRKLL